MKVVVVTGADGFIGSHLAELLVERGYRVKALTQYNSFNDWGWLEKSPLLSEFEVLSGDVRDPYYCRQITKHVDMVFHLAALIAIPYSYIAPASYVETNIKGTLHVCQAALENGCGRVIHTSTSEVYGTAQYIPMDEDHPRQAQSPYSASKIGADAIAMSFYRAFDLPVTIARPFNAYGPRQSARAVIPTMITQIASGKKQIQLGDVSPLRDFNYVKDICRGFVALAECDEAVGEEVNIATNVEISIGELFRLIQRLMKAEVEYLVEQQRVRPKKSEVLRLCGDNSKINKLTGFVPAYSLEQGLQETIAWFTEKTNLERYKTDVYSV